MPTRGRPESAIEAILSVKRNCVTDQVDIRVGQDEDDAKAFHLVFREQPKLIDYYYAPRRPAAHWFNLLVTMFLASHKYIGLMADDVRYLSKGWDERLLAHDEMLVYGPDGYQNEKMATHPFVHHEMVKGLTYFAPKELEHGCVDVYLEAVAKELGSIAYDKEIALKHWHYSVTHEPMDETYTAAAPLWLTDTDAFEKVLKPRVKEDAARVRAFTLKHSPLTMG